MKWDGLLTDIQLFFLHRKFARDLLICCTCVFSDICLLALGFCNTYCLLFVEQNLGLGLSLSVLCVSCTQLLFAGPSLAAGSGYNVSTLGIGLFCY
ncbi:hypothetical protein EV426DRAFT_352511 [Tirmania nivea]|nr:hypothetical protein EV426DRAFT_352511 [Tirmania nivea]